MKLYSCTIERFFKDIANHQMIIIRDDGFFRHIRFKRLESIDMYFDLITWKGHLCYTGDMGSYLFTRLDDMFEFFRTDREYMKRYSEKFFINPSYWAEKCICIDRSGIEKYSPEKFREIVMKCVDNFLEEKKTDPNFEKKKKQFIEAVENDILDYADDGEYAARNSIDNFDFYWGEKSLNIFSDFWETSLQEKTFRFIWCCYAIVWGIQQYDELKK